MYNMYYVRNDASLELLGEYAYLDDLIDNYDWNVVLYTETRIVVQHADTGLKLDF